MLYSTVFVLYKIQIFCKKVLQYRVSQIEFRHDLFILGKLLLYLFRFGQSLRIYPSIFALPIEKCQLDEALKPVQQKKIDGLTAELNEALGNNKLSEADITQEENNTKPKEDGNEQEQKPNDIPPVLPERESANRSTETADQPTNKTHEVGRQRGEGQNAEAPEATKTKVEGKTLNETLSDIDRREQEELNNRKKPEEGLDDDPLFAQQGVVYDAQGKEINARYEEERQRARKNFQAEDTAISKPETKGDTTIVQQRDELKKAFDEGVERFLSGEGLSRAEYEKLPQDQRKVINDKFQDSEINKAWEASENSKKLNDLNHRITQGRIYANGVAQGQIENGHITAGEVKTRLEKIGIPVPQDILEKASKEQKNNDIFVKNGNEGSTAERLQGQRQEGAGVHQEDQVFRDRLGERIRAAEVQLERPLTRHEKEDVEKQTAYDFAKENNLWIGDLYSLGDRTLQGGNENTLVVDKGSGLVYKSNNLFNSEGSITRFFEGIDGHNSIFPNSKYTFVGFTGTEVSSKRVPYVEPIVSQKYIPNAEQASQKEIDAYMESKGFEKVNDHTFRNDEYTVSDLRPRNVLKDPEGNIHVIDDVVVKNEVKQNTNPATQNTFTRVDSKGNTRTYTRREDGTFWGTDKNGQERRVTNKTTLKDLRNQHKAKTTSKESEGSPKPDVRTEKTTAPKPKAPEQKKEDKPKTKLGNSEAKSKYDEDIKDVKAFAKKFGEQDSSDMDKAWQGAYFDTTGKTLPDGEVNDLKRYVINRLGKEKVRLNQKDNLSFRADDSLTGELNLEDAPAKVKEVKDVNNALAPIAGKDPLRPQMTMIHHNAKEGVVEATDSHVAVRIPKEGITKDEMIDPKTGTTVDVTNTPYPNVGRLIPAKEKRTSDEFAIQKKVSVSDLMAKVNALVRANRNIGGVIPEARMSIDGTEAYFFAKILNKALTALAQTGTKEVNIYVRKGKTPMLFMEDVNSPKKVALVMPVQGEHNIFHTVLGEKATAVKSKPEATPKPRAQAAMEKPENTPEQKAKANKVISFLGKRFKGLFAIGENAFRDKVKSLGLDGEAIRWQNINNKFNNELNSLNPNNADGKVLWLGLPTGVLKAVGLPAKQFKLYGNKAVKKAREHGYSVKDLKNLPIALQDRIAVFEGSHKDSFAILTEMEIGGKKTLVSVEANKQGELDVNLISSIYGKDSKGVIDWINKNKVLYADKEKALSYLQSTAPIAATSNNSELQSATKVIKDFKNPKVEIPRFFSAWHGSPHDFDSFSGGATSDNAKGFNYVVFDDKAITITNKVKFMRDKTGTIYGLYDPKENKIYLNPETLNPDTVWHEATHFQRATLQSMTKSGDIGAKSVMDQYAKLLKPFVNQLEKGAKVVTVNGQKIDLGSEVYRRAKGETKAEYRDRIEDELWAFLGQESNAKLWAKNDTPFKRAVNRFREAVATLFKRVFGLGSKEDISKMTLGELTEHTAKQLQNGKLERADVSDAGVRYSTSELMSAAKTAIKDIVDLAFHRNSGTKVAKVGYFNDYAKRILSEVSGLNLKRQVSFDINESDVRHSQKRHLGKNEKDGRNLPLTESDYDNILDVVSNPDRIGYIGTDKDTGLRLFEFQKEYSDGDYTIVQFVGRSGGRLSFKTIYKNKKGIQQREYARKSALPLNVQKRSVASLSYDANVPNLIDFNTPDVVERLGKSNDIRFQILGEKGAKALDRFDEATHRMDNLDVARQMEEAGKAPKEVRLATGWERGKDKKWRYEIGDTKLITKQVTDRGTKEIKNVKTFGEWLSESKKNKNPDSSAFLGDFVAPDKAIKEGEVWSGESLSNAFQAYPELRNVKITTHDGGGAKGRVEERRGLLDIPGDVNNMTISLRSDLSINEAQSVLQHELQHIIQNIEGFAKGGNLMTASRLSSEEVAEVSRVEKSIRDAISHKNSGKWIWESSTLEEIIESDNSLPTNIKEWAVNIVRGGQDEINSFLEDTPMNQYKRLAGETEARNVQSRMGMTPEQRREALLSETEDVAREDQIVMMDGVGQALSLDGGGKGKAFNTSKEVIEEWKKNGVASAEKKLRDSNWFKSLPDETKQNLDDKGLRQFLKDQLGAVRGNMIPKQKTRSDIENDVRSQKGDGKSDARIVADHIFRCANS